MRREAMLYEKLSDGMVRCFLCAHHCRILPGGFGLCGVRQNIDGRLFSLVYGEVIAAHLDPIEKKPLYHFLPGTKTYSIATIGCNFKCGFCQNWQISQVSKKTSAGYAADRLAPEEIVAQALKYKAGSISYTYTEPTIFFEFAYDTAKLAKEAGLKNIFVTNGYMTKEALETIAPYLDAANVDLKSFRQEFYQKICKANLRPVLETITNLKKIGVWLELTTLVIPGENDSLEELGEIARFIAGLDPEIPWHLSRFHPDYKFDQVSFTSVENLKQARELAGRCGLKHVYLGNI